MQLQEQRSLFLPTPVPRMTLQHCRPWPPVVIPVSAAAVAKSKTPKVSTRTTAIAAAIITTTAAATVVAAAATTRDY